MVLQEGTKVLWWPLELFVTVLIQVMWQQTNSGPTFPFSLGTLPPKLPLGQMPASADCLRAELHGPNASPVPCVGCLAGAK